MSEELGARHRTVAGLVGPLLAGEGAVDQEQMGAAVGRRTEVGERQVAQCGR